MKFKLLPLLLLSAPSVFAAGPITHVGNAKYTFEDRAFASLFDRTLILGHTLSADFLVGMVSRSVGPGTILAEKYAGKPVLANLAEPRAMSAVQMKVDPESLGAPIAGESTWERGLRHLRASLPVNIGLEPALDKIARLVDRTDDDLDRVYDQSTAIVGIDAFYLSATTSFDGCADFDVDDVLEKFVTKTFADGKIVILGNVPREDYGTFSYPNRLAIYPQIEECRVHINRALARSCTTDRNCYVVDLETIVARLNRDRFLTLKDGTKISRVQTRPDGVNLSNRGTQFIVEDILRSLRAHPPQDPQSGASPMRPDR